MIASPGLLQISNNLISRGLVILRKLVRLRGLALASPDAHGRRAARTSGVRDGDGRWGILIEEARQKRASPPVVLYSLCRLRLGVVLDNDRYDARSAVEFDGNDLAARSKNVPNLTPKG